MVRNSHMYKTWVEVDAVSLRHNFTALAKHLGKSVTPICIVKSNAYGHGLLEVTSIFRRSNLRANRGGWISGVFFGVDSIEEAIQLKKSGIKNPALILGCVPPAMLASVVKNNFRVS